MEPPNYLTNGYTVRSWLLTTDHKRIALLYLLGVTFFFWIGGFAALLIRLELLTPAGHLVQAETYNKLFTMHGVMMVFFFLIPAIPSVLGNFLIPIMWSFFRQRFTPSTRCCRNPTSVEQRRWQPGRSCRRPLPCICSRQRFSRSPRASCRARATGAATGLCRSCAGWPWHRPLPA